jgi:hypothetical protein
MQIVVGGGAKANILVLCNLLVILKHSPVYRWIAVGFTMSFAGMLLPGCIPIIGKNLGHRDGR